MPDSSSEPRASGAESGADTRNDLGDGELEAPPGLARIEVPGQWRDFLQQFGEGWASPQVDEFVARFRPLFAGDAVMVQPMSPTVYGPDGLERLFRGFFAMFPDIRGQIVRWGASSDALFIEMELVVKVGRRTVTLRTCDHVVLDADGIVKERWAFLDPLPLIGALLRSPSVWPRLLKARG